MVYYFKSTVVDPPAELYVGKHKEENEELISHGWEEDIWFHVDKLSSAHVYLRLQTGEDWTKIPKALLEDCAQLTKANSIEGNKKDNVTIIYTPWSNLRKDASMVTGQVSFHHEGRDYVKKILVAERTNAIINRLNKTRTESFHDLKALKDAELKRKSKEQRIASEEKKRAEKKEREEREAKKWQKEHAYEELQNEENMRSNEDGFDEDDFM